MTITTLIHKVNTRIWAKLVHFSRKKWFYHFLYRSHWHYLFSPKENITEQTCYFAARPNPGAGIGHQLANWIAGYWFARQFGLRFAHIPFSTPKWEAFFGFGVGEEQFGDLIEKGYKVRKLPLFDETDHAQVERVGAIMQRYAGKKVVFLAEQDQFYRDQFGVIDAIKDKFYHAAARENNRLIYSPQNYNIAIHVRRGDIAVGTRHKNPNLQIRWQDNDYFKNVLTNVLAVLQIEKPVAIHLFSQGEEADFEEFKSFQGLRFCLDMDARDSFLHMVYADLLITSKSSFSYKPALLNNGIKVSPKFFWHGYPATQDWIMADENGNFNKKSIIA